MNFNLVTGRNLQGCSHNEKPVQGPVGWARGKSVRGGGKVKSQCRCISACNKQLFLYSTLNNTAKICFLNVCNSNGKRNKMYENNMIFS